MYSYYLQGQGVKKTLIRNSVCIALFIHNIILDLTMMDYKRPVVAQTYGYP